MNKDFLLPYGFKRVGWVLLVPTLALGIYSTVHGFDYPGLEAHASVLNNVAIIGILAGCLLISCSRERIEDEMIGQLRLNALLAALYLQVAILIVSALFVYDFAYLYIMGCNLVTLPIVFTVFFRTMLWQQKCRLNDEK